MSEGKLTQIHGRELAETRRSRFYLLGLAIAIILVVVALVMAVAAIAGTI